MPPAIPLILAGAGLYLGAKWLAKAIARKADEARRVAEEMQRQAAAGRTASPRDLGALEMDPATGTYVPRDKA